MREIAKNRIGAAFTEDGDQGVRDWMVDPQPGTAFVKGFA